MSDPTENFVESMLGALLESRECEHKWRDYSEYGGDFVVNPIVCRDCGKPKLEFDMETETIVMIPAKDIRPGMEFSTDGFTVTGFIELYSGDIFIVARKDGHEKLGIVHDNHLLPIWKG